MTFSVGDEFAFLTEEFGELLGIANPARTPVIDISYRGVLYIPVEEKERFNAFLVPPKDAETEGFTRLKMEDHYFIEPDYVQKHEDEYVEAINEFMKDRSKTNMNRLYALASNSARTGRKSWQTKVWGGSETVIVLENEDFEVDGKQFTAIGFMVTKNFPLAWMARFAIDFAADIYWYGYNAYRSDYGSIKPDGNDNHITLNLRSQLMSILKAIYPDAIPEETDAKLTTSEIQSLALSVHQLADGFATRLGGIQGKGSNKDLDKALKEYKTMPFETGKDFHAFIKTLDYFLNEISYQNQAEKFIEASKSILTAMEKKLNALYASRTEVFSLKTRKEWESEALKKGNAFDTSVDAVNLLNDLFLGDTILACNVWQILTKLDENELPYSQLLKGITSLLRNTEVGNSIPDEHKGAFFSYLRQVRDEKKELMTTEDYIANGEDKGEKRIFDLINAGISGEVALFQIMGNRKEDPKLKENKIQKALAELDHAIKEEKKVSHVYIDKAEEFALMKDICFEGETTEELQRSALALLVRCNNGVKESAEEIITTLTTSEQDTEEWDTAYYTALSIMQNKSSIEPATFGEVGAFYLWVNGVMHDRAETKKKVESVMNSIPDSHWDKLKDATENLAKAHAEEIAEAEQRGADRVKAMKDHDIEYKRVEQLIQLAKENAAVNDFKIDSTLKASELLTEIYGEQGLADRIIGDFLSKELPKTEREKLRIEVVDTFLTESSDHDLLGAFFSYIDGLGD